MIFFLPLVIIHMIIIKLNSNDTLETIYIHQYKNEKKIINRNQICQKK